MLYRHVSALAPMIGGAPVLQWRKAADDGSAWVADPEPECHLAVWQGERGWEWHVLGPDGRVIVQHWAEPDAAAAKAMADRHYRAYREQRWPARTRR